MRNLTQQEIDQAPEWAQRYVLSADERVIRWQDNNSFKWDDCEFRQYFSDLNFEKGKRIPRSHRKLVQFKDY